MSDQTVSAEVQKLQGLEKNLQVAEIHNNDAERAKARAAFQSEIDSVNKEGKGYASQVYGGLEKSDAENGIPHFPAIRMDGDHLVILADDRVKKDWLESCDRDSLKVPLNAPAEQYEQKKAARDKETSKLYEEERKNDERSKFGLPLNAPESQVQELQTESQRLCTMQKELANAIRSHKDVAPYVIQLQNELNYINKRPEFAQRLATGMNNDNSMDDIDFIKGRGIVLSDWDTVVGNATGKNDTDSSSHF